MKINEIQKSILKTIVFFDTLCYPLKIEEIFENLQTIDKKWEVSFSEVKKNLFELKNFVESKDDFWFLKGKSFLVNERKKREKISKKRWEKLKRIIKIINHLPFLEGVFVGGSLSLYNSRDDSDIDLLIVAKKGRIFTVRFFLTLLLDLIGERRQAKKIAGKICLSHYLTDESLRSRRENLYIAYTFLHFLPVISRKNIFERFRKENDWMKKYLCFIGLTFRPPFLIESPSKVAIFFEKILLGSFGNWLEGKLKEIQIKRKEKKYPQEINGGRIVLEDSLIELHPVLPEKEILREYQEKLKILK